MEFCQNCSKNKTDLCQFMFVYPECDLVCIRCGAVQDNRSNFVYAVDPLLKVPKSLNDFEPTRFRPGTCYYDARCDPSIYRRGRDYNGYMHIFHFNELVALPGLRPPIPEEAIDYILDGANAFYAKAANAGRTILGSDFSHQDAKGICELAAQLFERDCARRQLRQPTPRKGEREVVNSFRLRSYATRWVQVWRILLGECWDPKIHPILPWPLEERVRIRGSILVRLWLKYLHLRKGDVKSHALQTHNCRFALFIRAILYVESARTSLRRVFALTGIKTDKWYAALCYLWPKLHSEGGTIYVSSRDSTVSVEWPPEPPPLQKLLKDKPKLNYRGGNSLTYHPRWYESSDNIGLLHEKLMKRTWRLL